MAEEKSNTSGILKKTRGGDLFIVDNSDADWKVSAYLSECGSLFSFS
jgi:hypothetical protein